MDSRSKAEVTGAILTLQLATLESIGYKDGAREAMGRILEDLLSVYDSSWAPIQRARVLVTALSMSWRDEGYEGPHFNVDDMGQEALELLAREVSVACLAFDVISVPFLTANDRPDRHQIRSVSRVSFPN